MCIRFDAHQFQTVHHEIGHLYYGLACQDQPYLFRDGANDGFHEGVGDAISLSVTPAYLTKMGLRESPRDNDDQEITFLLNQALDALPRIPVEFVVSRWRLGVLSGRIKPGDYNAAWWDLKRRYQGIVAPVPRDESNFDPGTFYHIPNNVPYIRYYLASLLQYQFHHSLCRIAGHKGPLNQCTIFGNATAGAKFKRMLAVGASQPWQETLRELTGSRQIDASPIIRYFEPLKAWLDVQNSGRKCGW